MKSAINLLPLARRRQQILRRRVIQWTTLIGVVVAAVWVARWIKLREFRALDHELAAIVRECRPVRTMLSEIADMREQLARLTKQEEIAKAVEQQRPIVTVLGLVSMAAKQSAGRLQVTYFDVVDFQADGAAHSQPSGDSRFSGLTLSGVSLDSSAVAEFHDALSRSGLFADVRLIKSNERDEGGIALIDYEMRCEL